ncbi:hypothetical protein IWQ60_009219 [Tieghemiomyces parasiticus]|uniref:Uncharacterized protein n=1 Tax=Tieghemiomyces parasiticus TaxID=78921 RepID=A0A9W8DPR0_9FUNG|nr:hypothetical protein IWQ60_009219 [Tieghemiomyces parasiticus]
MLPNMTSLTLLLLGAALPAVMGGFRASIRDKIAAPGYRKVTQLRWEAELMGSSIGHLTLPSTTHYRNSFSSISGSSTQSFPSSKDAGDQHRCAKVAEQVKSAVAFDENFRMREESVARRTGIMNYDDGHSIGSCTVYIAVLKDDRGLKTVLTGDSDCKMHSYCPDYGRFEKLFVPLPANNQIQSIVTFKRKLDDQCTCQFLKALLPNL